MKNIIVADSKRHGAIMLAWMGLDPKRWTTVAYGDPVKGKFLDCLIIRPLKGVTEAHGAWFAEVLHPRIVGHIGTPQEGWYGPAEPLDGPLLAEPDWDV